jgi:signal recognition particle subunit SRP54
VRQLAQLRKLQGKGMEDVLGEDAAAVEQALHGGLAPEEAARAMGLPKGYTPPMAAGAMARARLMGYAPEPIAMESAKERDARKKKRKQERQARKKNRKRNRR